MTRQPWLLAAFAVFYILLQGLATAHAVTYGPDEHTHNSGEVCLLGNIAQRDGTADVPSLPVVDRPITRLSTVILPQICGAPDSELLLSARPRGPPSIQ